MFGFTTIGAFMFLLPICPSGTLSLSGWEASWLRALSKEVSHSSTIEAGVLVLLPLRWGRSPLGGTMFAWAKFCVGNFPISYVHFRNIISASWDFHQVLINFTWSYW